jgi:T5SS/PEP-CTERM-associated repeat protein
MSCLIAIVLSGAAFGQNVQWTNTSVNVADFNTAANWINGVMPGVTDEITWYDYPGPPSLNFYSVTLNVSGGGTFARWDQDYWYTVVNLNLNGNTLVFYPTGDFGYGVAAYGAAAVTNRVYGTGNLNVRSLQVGGAWHAVSSPLFELSGAGTRLTTGDGAGYIGNNSRVRIYDGAVISNDTSWATMKIGTGSNTNSFPMHAIVTLTDPGTRWDNTGLLVVGHVKGDGTLIVTNQAIYKGGNNVNLGGWQYVYEPVAAHRSQGTIHVTGSGSDFTTAGRVDVGLLSTGRVESVKGGNFTAPSMRLGVGYSDIKPPVASTDEDGTNTFAYGSMLADELGVIDVRGDVTVGVIGRGVVKAARNGEIYIGNNLDVNTGGQVTVSDAYISAGMSEMTDSLLRLELGAKAQKDYYLAVSGALTLSNVNLEIDLLGNFSASLNDEIRLISYSGDITGSFTGWTDGDTFTRDIYEFTYNQKTDETYLTVTAIPEPASILLLAGGIVAAFKLRRRA